MRVEVEVAEGTPGVSEAAIDFVTQMVERAGLVIRRMDSDYDRLNVHIKGPDDWSGGVSFSLDLIERVSTSGEAEKRYTEKEFLHRIATIRRLQP